MTPLFVTFVFFGPENTSYLSTGFTGKNQQLYLFLIYL